MLLSVDVMCVGSYCRQSAAPAQNHKDFLMVIPKQLMKVNPV